MSEEKQTNTSFTLDEIPQPGNEGIIPSDDVIEVEFNDPRLMGDLFDLVAETQRSHLNHDQIVDRVAKQLRFADRRLAAAEKLTEIAAELPQPPDELCNFSAELPFQTSNPTTYISNGALYEKSK